MAPTFKRYLRTQIYQQVLANSWESPVAKVPVENKKAHIQPPKKSSGVSTQLCPQKATGAFLWPGSSDTIADSRDFSESKRILCFPGQKMGGAFFQHPPPKASRTPPPPPCVTFRLVVVPLRGSGQSPVLPFACCVGSLLSVGRCGWCTCWCRFCVRGAQWLVCWGCAECGMVCRLRVSGAQ